MWRPLFLISDLLIYAVILILITYLVHILKSPLARQEWQAATKGVACKLALVVLAIYLGITLLDSIHFRKSNHASVTTSVLDILLKPYSDETETTYSKPFSKTSDALSFIHDVDGWHGIHEPLKRTHILGTDKVGTDVFYKVMKSIRTGVLIGSVTTLLMLPFAIILGLTAGFKRGWFDMTVQAIYSLLAAIPSILLIVASILSLQVLIERHEVLFASSLERSDLRLMSLAGILGITGWTGLCRYLRAEAMKLKESEFIQAAKMMQASTFYIMRKHLLPNVMHLVIITAAMDFSFLVLAEAVLSYLGVGVDANTYSFGNMINAARTELAREPIIWWPLLGSFVGLMGLVLSANIVADSIRDKFDPRFKNA